MSEQGLYGVNVTALCPPELGQTGLSEGVETAVSPSRVL